MKPRKFPKLALALPLIVAVPNAPARAQGQAQAAVQTQKGNDHLDSATVASPMLPAERLALGYRLADYARTTKDARAMIAAARIVDGVSLRKGAEPGTLEGKGKTAPAGQARPIEASELFAQAREFAAGDAALLAEIDAAQAEASRGCLGAGCGGAIRLVQYVPGNTTWTVRFVARGGEPFVVAARRDSATPVDLKVFDENNNLICQDMSHNVTMVCRINPIWTGPISAQAINHGEPGTGIAMVTS